MHEDRVVRAATVGELHAVVDRLKAEGWEPVNAFYYAWDGTSAGFEWKVRRIHISDDDLETSPFVVEEYLAADPDLRAEYERKVKNETPKRPSAADPILLGTYYLWPVLAGVGLGGVGLYLGIDPAAIIITIMVIGAAYLWWRNVE